MLEYVNAGRYILQARANNSKWSIWVGTLPLVTYRAAYIAPVHCYSLFHRTGRWKFRQLTAYCMSSVRFCSSFNRVSDLLPTDSVDIATPLQCNWGDYLVNDANGTTSSDRYLSFAAKQPRFLRSCDYLASAQAAINEQYRPCCTRKVQ